MRIDAIYNPPSKSIGARKVKGKFEIDKRIRMNRSFNGFSKEMDTSLKRASRKSSKTKISAVGGSKSTRSNRISQRSNTSVSNDIEE